MCYQNYYIARLAAKFVKVVACRHAVATSSSPATPGATAARRERDLEHEFERATTTATGRACVPERRQRARSSRRRLGRRRATIRTVDVFRSVLRRRSPTPEDPVDQALYFEAKTFLHGLLVVEDKLSMAHSLEARVPFLDNELVDFARRIPRTDEAFGRDKQASPATRP